MGTYIQRAAYGLAMKEEEERVIAAEQQAQLAMAVKAAREETLVQTGELMARIESRMGALASELAEVKAARRKEALEAQAYKRQAESGKRQKSLDAYFSRPLQHDVRPRAPPDALGEGYTARNISSGVFAQHVRAIEHYYI
jgi:hypothetical protein